MRGKSKVNLTASEAALFLVGFLLSGGGQHLLIQLHVPSPLLCLTAGQATLRSFHLKSEVMPCCAGHMQLQIQTGFHLLNFFHSNSRPSSIFQNISVDVKFWLLLFKTVTSFQIDSTQMDRISMINNAFFSSMCLSLPYMWYQRIVR